MMLVDTSIWIDHFHHGDEVLLALLKSDQVLMHPFVIGEVALGNLPYRDEVMQGMAELPMTHPVDDNEVIEMIVSHKLHGSGIGYVDAHLLAACSIADGTSLWTRDRRLAAAADRLGLSSRTRH